MKKLLFILLCFSGCTTTNEPTPRYSFEAAILFYSLGYSEGQWNGTQTMLFDGNGASSLKFSHNLRTQDSIRFVASLKSKYSEL